MESSTRNLQQLTKLQIESMHLGERGLMALSKCSKLEVFYMRRVFYYTDRVIYALIGNLKTRGSSNGGILYLFIRKG